MKKMFVGVSFVVIGLLTIGFNANSRECQEADKVYVSKTGDFKVEIRNYEPAGGSPSLVVIIPPTGGMNIIDKSYAENFCDKGLHAIIVKHWTGDEKKNFDLEVHTDFYQNGQTAIDTVLENHTHQKIGLLGTSVGGIHSSITWARHSEIKSAFFIVSGGGIPRIIAHSDQEILVKAKEFRFKNLGFKSDEEYVDALTRVIPYEPLKLPLKRENRKLGMVVSLDDLTVPTENQEDLRKLWKPDVEYFSNWGHVPTVIRTWIFKKNKITKFFLESLSENNFVNVIATTPVTARPHSVAE